MTTMTIQVPDDSVEFVEEFIERIGGSIEEKDKEAQEKPLDSFGAWMDIDLDPETYRKKLWRQNLQL